MASALLEKRVRGLMEAKGRLRQDELPGVTRDELAQWLAGRDPKTNGLKRLALALEADANYLIGIGDDYRAGGKDDNYLLAAAKMSFSYFARDLKTTAQQKERCQRVWEDDRLLLQDGAPVTAGAWRALAEMIDVGIGPLVTPITEVKRA